MTDIRVADRALLKKAALFIDERHLTEQTFAEVADWFTSVPGRPIVFRDFLRPNWAHGMAAAMRALPVWTRVATIYKGSRDCAEIDERDWAGHPDRAACHYVGRPLSDALAEGAMDAGHQKVIEQFLAFAVLTDVLRSWFTAGVGLALERRTSAELACYGRGDEIREHQDLFPGRVMAVNFYLGEDYRPGDGARLGFRNEAGEQFAVDPLFNTFSMIPIRDECWHWVEPFAGDGMGRQTVSIGIHHA